MRTLGIDLGGTWARGCLWDTGRPGFRRLRAKAVHWSRLDGCLSRWKLGRLDRLVLGSTGLWGSSLRAAKRSLSELALEVIIVSDLELMRDAAFAGGSGIAVVAGTGSAAIGKDPSGSLRRAGGWGPLLGDDGSAFWMGRSALRTSLIPGMDPLALAHSASPVREVAALAPKVLALYGRNAQADKIIMDAAERLAGLVRECSRGLRFPGPIPVSWRGGLFQNIGFLETFLAEIRRSDRRFVPRPPLLDSEVAAVLLYNLK